MKKEILFILLLLIPLLGCIEEQADASKFHGTWFPDNSLTGYHFEPSGNLLIAIKVGNEIFYKHYCTWSLDRHVLIFCDQRLNFKFDSGILYLYNFNEGKTQTRFTKEV